MEIVYRLNMYKLKYTVNNRGLSFGDTGLFCILAYHLFNTCANNKYETTNNHIDHGIFKHPFWLWTE